MKLSYSYHYKRFDANTKVYYSWSKNILIIKQDHECYFWLLLLIYCGRFDSKKRFYVHQVLLSMDIFKNMGSDALLFIVFSSGCCTAGATNTNVEHWACRLWVWVWTKKQVSGDLVSKQTYCPHPAVKSRWNKIGFDHK